jgi:hypothetical protein
MMRIRRRPADLLTAWRAIEDSGRQLVTPFHGRQRGLSTRLTSAGTMEQEVLALADWLRCLRVPAGALEATS